MKRDELEPGYAFKWLDPLLDKGWWGVILFAILFIPVGGLGLLVFTPLAWIFNPPWRKRKSDNA